jgi:Family of unknown function (DUF6600)/FecR protein
MKSYCYVRAVSLAAAGLFILIIGAQAQDYSDARVVRLSRADGEVLVSHPASDAWSEAPPNLPLQQGDTLATQSGLAEIEFENGAMGYLAENSVLEFTELDFSAGGRTTLLTLTQGTGTFYANLTTEDTFRVVTPLIDVAIPERAEFRVDAFRDAASVQVLQGRVSVSTRARSIELEKGQSVVIHSNDDSNFVIARLPEPDQFDQWVSDRSEIVQSGDAATLRYLNSPDSYGLSDLSIYGTWVNFTGYGFCWRPFSVGFSWTPYVNGIWILDPRLGWIWVSNEAWGWMPYHFGSWLLSPTLGWLWVPGGPGGLRHWEPARVNWVHSGNQVGWVAMSPLDRVGAPANLTQGLVTRQGISPQENSGGREQNQVVSPKDRRGITLLKQPPANFASRPATATTRSGFASQIARVPQVSAMPKSIVFDRGSRTFINSNAPAISATPAPLPAGGSEIPRVMLPPSAPIDSHINRILSPPAPPAVLQREGNRPGSAQNPVPQPLNVPGTRPFFSSPSVGEHPGFHSGYGQVVPPSRPVNRPSAAMPRPAQMPSAPTRTAPPAQPSASSRSHFGGQVAAPAQPNQGRAPSGQRPNR